ncbi:bactofilin family protein [Salinispira pacifica]
MTRGSLPEETLINSIVGEGTHFRGNLELNGLLRIDGDYSGTIQTAGKVIIGKNGRADCTINAATVVVGGVSRGAIYATEKVIILASAVVIGIVQAPRLIAEEGVLLDGEYRIYGAPAEAPAAAAEKERPRGLFGFRKPAAENGSEEDQGRPRPQRTEVPGSGAAARYGGHPSTVPGR